MKVLVIGGTGFIGSNLCGKLVEEGHEVRILDNFYLGNMKNIESIKDKVEVINGDIRNYDAVDKATKGMDIVFNQAAASSSPMFLENLRDAVAVNVDGFINVLNACKANGVKKLIYASTSSLYGNSTPPLREDVKIVPVNFYASTKLLNEHLAIIFSKEHELETIGFRYMSIYGPHESFKTVYANMASQFLWEMKQGKQPILYGDGTQTRDFTFVADVVNASILVMNSKKDLSGQIFNIGTGKETSLNELVVILNKILGTKIKPKYVPNPIKNYINTQLGDVSKLKETVGYEPRYTLEEGLKETIAKQ